MDETRTQWKRKVGVAVGDGKEASGLTHEIRFISSPPPSKQKGDTLSKTQYRNKVNDL
uniref:Uncharacterized protein n=1 Tax=Cucumis sativus TaxID=3659 RepID=A0A0A0KBJ9_CUCSA